MEMIKVSKDIDKSYYLQSEEDFGKLYSVINLMPSFAIASTSKELHSDVYFDTTDNFLKKLDSTVRVRFYPELKQQILSIVCKNLGEKREFQMNMEFGDEIASKDEYLFFLEDKLQDIYVHRFDFDVVRILKGLKKFLCIETNRTIYEIINNQGFKCNACFDNVTYVSKRNKNYDSILEIKLDCWQTEDNLYFFNKFVKELEYRVVLIPMNEKKLAGGLRSFKQVKGKKPVDDADSAENKEWFCHSFFILLLKH